MSFSKLFFAGAIGVCFQALQAQENSATLDTLYVFDNQVKRFSKTETIVTISAADLVKNSDNLADVLRFQAPIYLKENGRGMVASPSFRGTNAQHTALVWNGININSAFLGQADLNNFSLLSADQILVKAGGGSVLYGSGAVGGSILINQALDFDQGFGLNFFSEAGSFGTYQQLLKSAYSTKNFSFKVIGTHNFSENDYQVEPKNFENTNGKYRNASVTLAAAYKISPKQQLSWISEHYDGLQNYPISNPSQTKTKYETQNLRTLLIWDWQEKRTHHILRTAYTEENFKYFASIDQPKSSGGTGKNIILKDDFNWKIHRYLSLNTLLEFQNNRGEGYQSGIDEVSRNQYSGSALLRYSKNENLALEGGIKKDFTDDFASPLLYSFSGKWQVSPWYSLGGSFSKNFRIPSFNDLYWQPGGNSDLRPETSLQGELRHIFEWKNLKFSITPYYIKIKDLIQWVPTGSYWSALNIKNAESYGFEYSLEAKTRLSTIDILGNLGYAFTHSVDLDTGFERMYVPKHKLFGNLNLGNRWADFYLQGTFNGLTYTTSDENRDTALPPYFVLNTGISAKILKQLKIGFKINNVFNQVYETMAYFPMPMRNYRINLTLNI